MKTRKFALVALVAASALTFAGCSGATAPEPTVAPSAAAVAVSPPVESALPEAATDAGPNDVMPEYFEPGDFYFVSAENVVGKFTIPGKAPADLEALRQTADAPAVSYLEVKLDARDATDGANMYALTVFDPEGKKYEFTSAPEVISGWQELLPYDEDDPTLYNRYVDAYNAESYHVEMAEVGTIRMVSTSTTLPTKITRVAVSPLGGFDEVEAYPVSMGQGLDLDY